MNNELAHAITNAIIANLQENAQPDCIDTVDGYIEVLEEDFTFDTECGQEYRIILDSAIEAIWKEELAEVVRDCNPELFSDEHDMGSMARYMKFDWEQFYRDAEHDGFGHHFSGYDGSEEHVTFSTEEGKTEGYYIFRIN